MLIGLLVGLALSWYYFNYMQNNTYLKNVIIYFVFLFTVNIIDIAISRGEFHIISLIIICAISSLLIIKIMEFVRSRTHTLVMFVVLSELLTIAVSFVLSFILAFLF